MIFPSSLRTFFIGTETIEVFVPDPQSLTAAFNKEDKPASSFYWGKVWPAAIGMCTFLQQHLFYIQNKTVVELAAGVGLPGIFSSPYAKQVCISDVEPAAVELVQLSITHHDLTNVDCRSIDWNDWRAVPLADVILLSDINYERTQFDELFRLIQFLLSQKCIIMLSTPQRLMAKDFINSLLLFCIDQDIIDVEIEGVKTAISVFVLKK